jgi:hypothetical protein
MSYFAQTPKATAELIRGLVGVVLMTAAAVLILAYGPDLWAGLVDGMAAAPARIVHALSAFFSPVDGGL